MSRSAFSSLQFFHFWNSVGGATRSRRPWCKGSLASIFKQGSVVYLVDLSVTLRREELTDAQGSVFVLSAAKMKKKTSSHGALQTEERENVIMEGNVTFEGVVGQDSYLASNSVML